MSQRRGSRSLRLLIDSSAYFALLDQDDVNYAQALAIRDQLVSQRWQFFTTSFILAETHALILNRLGQRIATQFLREIERSTTTVVWVTPEDVQEAKSIIYQYGDKDFSLTDAAGFVVMEQLGITHAFTFDHHFTQYGLNILTPSSL